MRLARTSFRGFTASLKSLWITGSHANSAMLVLPCSSSCLQEPQDLRSELFLTISTVHAGHLPHSGPPMCSFFFVLHLLVHHLTLPFVYDDQNRNRSTAHVHIFGRTERREATSSNLLIFFSPFVCFANQPFLFFSFRALCRENILFFAREEDDKFSNRPCTLVFDTLSN